MITKSDFLLYCEAPRHLWAKKNGKIEVLLSEFDQRLISEGYKVEALAHGYIDTILKKQNPGLNLIWQETYIDGQFETRVDALLYNPASNSYDLFEVKSSTGVDKKDIYDVAFQSLILSNQIEIDHLYLLHLNKEYIRNGDLDLSFLFIAEEVTSKVEKIKAEIEILRQDALLVAELGNPNDIDCCLNPNECPCLDVCHPNLPEFSIFNIPNLSRNKKKELMDLGIDNAKDIPGNFGLNDKQRIIVQCAKTNNIHIDLAAIHEELGKVTYPVYFLDYETCISAIPQYDCYHPQQQIVFQYSLHKIKKPGDKPTHTEHLSITKDDPSLSLLDQLMTEIGGTGTIIVWNKTFEMTMNKEMAKLHPEYSEFLEKVNVRIYDLGDMVNLGYYLHPGFKGSWSIKKVLPVMVPELSYKGMEINKGDQASITWLKICFGPLDEPDKQRLSEALLRYCELDTLAMVEIFNIFRIL